MDIKQAMRIASSAYPNMYIRGASRNKAGWAFAFDSTKDGPFPSVPGLPAVGVDGETGRLYDIVPGNDAFWKFMRESTSVELPKD